MALVLPLMLSRALHHWGSCASSALTPPLHHESSRVGEAPSPGKTDQMFPGLAVSYATGVGQWNNITYSLTDFKSDGGGHAGRWTLQTPDIHAVITQQAQAGHFDLSFTPKIHDVPRVSFPFLTGVPSMDDDPNMFALFPMLGGIFVKNGADGYGSMEQDAVMSYPGSFHSPYVMLATAEAAVMAAATTWPPHHVHPKRRMVMMHWQGWAPPLRCWAWHAARSSRTRSSTASFGTASRCSSRGSPVDGRLCRAGPPSSTWHRCWTRTYWCFARLTTGAS
eukprot:COSAG02_NODE_8917_length_2401_cov_1.577324_4_plen_279_part_00